MAGRNGTRRGQLVDEDSWRTFDHHDSRAHGLGARQDDVYAITPGGDEPGARAVDVHAVVDDESQAADLVDVLRAVLPALRTQHRSRSDLLRALLPEQALAASPALVEQVRRNAEARADLARDFGLLDAAQVAQVHGSRARNSAAVASRLRKEGRIFAVRTEDGARFPAFQFDPHGRPRAVVAHVLSAFEGRLNDWDVALWFTGRTGWLGDLRPVDLLDGTEEEQAAVVEAARHLAADLSA